MPIYTRTGDKGKTSLFDGTRVLKSDIRVETYGTIDELNSHIGFAISQLSTRNTQLKRELIQIQNDLLDIGSALATPHAMSVVGLETRPKDFEALIDQMTGEMPELKHFILPGGGKAGASLHVCRTIARRCERRIIALVQEAEVDQSVVVYLNRFSDLLFTMARYVNHVEKKKEVVWKKK